MNSSEDLALVWYVVAKFATAHGRSIFLSAKDTAIGQSVCAMHAGAQLPQKM